MRDDHEAVVRALDALYDEHTPETYRRVFRAGQPSIQAERAAWFNYLTNGGYDGAWKRTRDGRPTISPSPKPLAMLDRANLAAGATALEGTGLEVRDFRCLAAEPGDLVVLDPPYLDPAGDETHAYWGTVWSKDDQCDIIGLARQLRDDGVHVVICQPETAETESAFQDWVSVAGSPNKARREAFLLANARNRP